MKITKALIRQVAAMESKAWHDAPWHDFMGRPDVEAVRYARQAVDSEADLDAVKAEAEKYLAAQKVASDKQAAWSRANERKRIAAGGRRMPGGVLPTEAAEALASLQASGYASSAMACIAKALLAAAVTRC